MDKPIKLEVGKSYIDRSETEVVTIIRYDESEPIYRFVGNNGKNYGPTGAYIESLYPTRFDLVREIKY